MEQVPRKAAAAQQLMHIQRARTTSDYKAFARLAVEYSTSLGVSLAFQNFEQELATLPGCYAEPWGCILLARDASSAVVGCVALRPLAKEGAAAPLRGQAYGHAVGNADMSIWQAVCHVEQPRYAGAAVTAGCGVRSGAASQLAAGQVQPTAAAHCSCEAAEHVAAGGSAANSKDAVRTEAICEMKRLWVDPSARGAGIGRALVDAVIHAAQDIGYVYMVLDTLERLQAANAIYQAAGFTRRRPYYANPLPNVVYWELSLQQPLQQQGRSESTTSQE